MRITLYVYKHKAEASLTHAKLVDRRREPNVEPTLNERRQEAKKRLLENILGLHDRHVNDLLLLMGNVDVDVLVHVEVAGTLLLEHLDIFIILQPFGPQSFLVYQGAYTCHEGWRANALTILGVKNTMAQSR